MKQRVNILKASECSPYSHTRPTAVLGLFWFLWNVTYVVGCRLPNPDVSEMSRVEFLAACLTIKRALLKHTDPVALYKESGGFDSSWHRRSDNTLLRAFTRHLEYSANVKRTSGWVFSASFKSIAAERSEMYSFGHFRGETCDRALCFEWPYHWHSFNTQTGIPVMCWDTHTYTHTQSCSNTFKHDTQRPSWSPNKMDICETP